eukprot:g17742.t1
MWKFAQVWPVHKKQDKSNLTNYHPISLLSVISKVMEGVINSAVKGHSAPDLITAFVEIWTKQLDSRGEARVTALDIKAAFDRVWYQGALAKLESMGIRGQTLRWLESHLTHRKVVVVVGGQSSQFQDISAGVPHSIVFGPTIFSCFNDLPSIITPEVGMCSHHRTMFSTIREFSDTEADCVQMKQHLDKIQAWADKWQVTFTPDKCQAATIANKRPPNHHLLTFNGVTITESPTINILGLI